MEFIYTTCAPCVNATRTMQKLQAEFGAQGFQAIAVAFNPNAEVLVEDFVNSNHFTLPVGWTLGSDVTSFLGYGPADRFVAPQFVLIDATGLIRYQTPAQGDDGRRNGAMLRDQICKCFIPRELRPKKLRRRIVELPPYGVFAAMTGHRLCLFLIAVLLCHGSYLAPAATSRSSARRPSSVRSENTPKPFSVIRRRSGFALRRRRR